MRTFWLGSFVIVAVCLLCSKSDAENWKKFFTNQANYEFFYDQDSVVYPDKNTVQVWYKSAPNEAAENKAWAQWLELREVDCTRRRYKLLQGRVFYTDKPMKTLEESSWIYLEPGDLYDAFYKSVCSQTKRSFSR